MIVQCESCRAQFDVDDEILRPSGRKLKCSQCQAVFFQPPPKSRENKTGEPGATEARSSDEPLRRDKPSHPPPVAPHSPSGNAPFDDEQTLLRGATPDHDLFSGIDEPLGDDDQDDGLEGLDEIQVDDVFGDGAEEEEEFEEPESRRPDPFGSAPEEISAEDALGGLMGSFSDDEDEDENAQEKSGLIETYLREVEEKTGDDEGDDEAEDEEEEEEWMDEDEPASPPPAFRSSHAPPEEEEDDSDTVLSSSNRLALGKPTARELELARQAQEKLTAKPPPPPPAPVVQEPIKESFINVEQKWDTGDTSEEDEGLDDEEPASRSSGGSRKLWALALLLLLSLGMGAVTLTDWWTYRRFDLFSDYRFTEAKGEWRRYPHGMVLLVTGSIVNTSRVVRNVPSIRVMLLDGAGNEVDAVLAYPGRVIEDGLLDESSEPALRTMAGLQGEEKRLKVNRMMPGNTTPFQVLFVKPPANSARFRMQLVQPDGKGQTVREKSLPDKNGGGNKP